MTPCGGFWIAMIPPMVLGFGLYGIVGAVAVIIGYWFINGTLSNVVAPHFYGTGLNLAPVMALVAVMFWGITVSVHAPHGWRGSRIYRWGTPGS